jgi:hypothetical protein
MGEGALRHPREPAPAKTRTLAPRPQSAPEAGSSEVLRLQRTAGNQAVNAVLASDDATIRRQVTGVKKPSAGVFSDKRSLSNKLEKAANAAKHNDEIRPIARQLFDLDATYYCQFVIHKVEKHTGKDELRKRYSQTMPREAWWPMFDLAWRSKSAEGVAFFAKAGWDSNQDGVKQRALDDPDFFVDHFLIEGLRRDDAGKQLLQGLVEEKELLGNIRTADPVAFGRLVTAVPVLKLVRGVEAELDAEGESEGEADGDIDEEGELLSYDKAVHKLFRAFIENKGMEIGYSGTAIDTNLIALTGRTKASDKEREKQKRELMPDMPAKLSTACHQLLGLFQSVLKSYPGLERLDVKPGDEPSAVLTEPLNTLPGGLISKDYSGNVFDQAGKSTGQIFFSGNRAKISQSHSWVIINGIAYDPVLGTRGDDVADAIGGRFEFNDGEEVATEIGGNRVLTRDRTLKTSGEHGLTAAWRLTTGPS